MKWLKRKKGKVVWRNIPYPTEHRYLMATDAFHRYEISRESPDICLVDHEDKDNYYGMWVFGIGYFNIRFPKSTTRQLTKQEFEKYSTQKIQWSSGVVFDFDKTLLERGTNFET